MLESASSRTACALLVVLAIGDVSPVPFSTSATDGLPTKDNWDMFTTYYQQVKTDATMSQQRTTLLKYAADQVTLALPNISKNLKGIGIDGFDMVWPGDGFNGVAYGGLYEALVQLQSAGVTKVGKRMGASGGAASTILTMQDSNLFLELYQVYALYYQGRPDRVAAEAVRDTGLTAAIYAEAVRDDATFKRIQRDGLIVSSCNKGGNTLFHKFQTRVQLVGAGYSSGDASLLGETVGTVVNGTDSGTVGHCGDGGAVTVFPGDIANVNFAVLLYKTPWVSVSSPTASSIETLFRAGVDNAIATLTSPSLSASNSGGSMIAARPGPGGIVTATEYATIASVSAHTMDVNLGSAMPADFLASIVV